ncbi:MAG: ribosome-associated translation inhibitor RaiA [Desulfobacterales bacterium]
MSDWNIVTSVREGSFARACKILLFALNKGRFKGPKGDQSMKIPLQITARNFELTKAIDAAIREQAEKLDRIYDQILRCEIVLEVPHQRQTKGVIYNVRINVTVPGGQIQVSKELHEDLYVSINRAFDKAHRQLKQFVSQQRRDVKYHEETPFGIITKIFPEEGYGFLTTPDGREIYFHENSVVGRKFKVLEAGSKVRFVEA